MTWVRRPAVLGALALALAPVLAVAGPGRPAEAWSQGAVAPPSRPLTMPPSVVTGSLDSATATQRAAAIARTADPGALPRVTGASSVGLSGGAARLLGPAGIGVTGLSIGWEIGSAIAGVFGLDSDGALHELLGTAPGPGFEPNAGAPLGSPGWQGSGLAGSWVSEGSGAPVPVVLGPGPVAVTVVGGGGRPQEWPPAGYAKFADGGYDTVDWRYLVRGSSGATSVGPSGYECFASGNGTQWICPQRAGATPGVTYPADDGVVNWVVDMSLSMPVVPRSADVGRYNLGTTLRAWCRAADGTGRFESAGNRYFDNYLGDPAGLVRWDVYCSAGRSIDHVELSLLAPYGDPGQVLRWYPPGHAEEPPPARADPARRWETRTTCSGGSTTVAASATFRESGGSWPAIPQPAPCAPGLSVERVQVWQVTPGGEEADRLLVDQDVPQVVRDWQSAYPQCADGSCALDLHRIDPGTGARVSCFADPAACLGWALDPDRATRYECSYAGQVVPLEDCRVYVRVFPPTGTTPELVDPAGTPFPDPGAVPTPGPAGEACPPPVSVGAVLTGRIVYTAVNCALTWAFVPSPGELSTQASRVSTALGGTALGQVGEVTAGLGAALGGIGVGSCRGLGFDLGTVHEKFAGFAITPFYTCDGIAQDVSDVVRPLLVGGVWLVALSTSTWMVMSAFGLRL